MMNRSPPLAMPNSVASIDLGLDNLVALTSNQPGFIPLLVNGRPLKSINQFYNKRYSRLQSQLKGNRKTSPRIQRLTRCRNQKVDNYLHHASRLIIDILIAKQIGTLVIGKNAQWKTEIDLGKQTNQNFVSIPHSRLIEMLEYKARLVGITVIVQEESYTSRANFLGLDPIPVYGKTEKEPVFTGKRIKRGLYKTSTGQLINSDVNAAYNILRKAIPNAFSDGIGSCVVQPRRVNPLKVKVKGEGLKPPMSINDYTFTSYALTQKLEYVAAKSGKKLYRVDPRHTSQTCSKCRHVDKESRKGEKFICTNCGHIDDANLQAARNVRKKAIETYGLTIAKRLKKVRRDSSKPVQLSLFEIELHERLSDNTLPSTGSPACGQNPESLSCRSGMLRK